MENTDRSELRILIISDELQFSAAICRALGDQCYHGCVECRPADAAQMAAIANPLLAVMNVGTDDCESQQLATQLRGQQPSIHCLLIANRDATINPQLVEQPWIHVVRRPFSMLQFVATIDGITRREVVIRACDDAVTQAVQPTGP